MRLHAIEPAAARQIVAGRCPDGYTAPPAADLSSLDPAFAADWALAQSMVPEPGVALIGLAAGATMLRRARRK